MSAVAYGRIRHTEVENIPAALAKLLPSELLWELRQLPYTRELGRIEELRLRRGRRTALTTARGVYRLEYVCTPRTMDELLDALCGGSRYAHRETIVRGYLTLEGGIRVGVCGRAAVECGRVVGVYDITSFNFRFPKHISHLGESLLPLLREKREGVLVYAPPGEGKTTLLRSLCEGLAGGCSPQRVAVVDTRGELSVGLEDPFLTVDLLTGYPRALAIEIAARTMNAQWIVCDEIGEPSEAEAILGAQNCGVPFLASAHGSSAEGLLLRPGIRLLHHAHVFGTYVGIRRREGDRDFTYTVTKWEDVHG